ncbi:HEAT repeat domain-containing protein, partial [bacterium]|nr:HEAT repeat domain-containing protein [bacterium]
MARSPHLLALASVALLAAGCGGSGSRDIDSLLADVMSQAGQARAERILAEHGRAYIKPLSSIVTGRDIEKARRDHGIHGDPAKLRLPAILALGMIAQHASLANSEAAVAAQPLLAVLREKGKRELRIEAARALGSFSQLSGPANDLVLLLREDDGELADAAVDSLARTALRSVHRIALPPSPGAGAVTTKDWRRLEERLGSSDDDIRLDAVREMAASRDPRAEPVLRQRVASDRSRDVRYAAIRACRVLAEEEPEGAHARTLRAALPTTFSKDDDSRVVLVAAEILADSQPDRVGAFLARIGQARQKAKEALLADARSEAYDEATRADAVTALTHLPGEDRDGLLATFLDGTRSEGARVRR